MRLYVYTYLNIPIDQYSDHFPTSPIQNGSGLIPLPPPPASVMNGTLSSGAATSGSALATAIASIESRSVSEDSRDDEGDTMIEEILRHQAEYLEKLPRHLLPYELARARALNTMKLPRD